MFLILKKLKYPEVIAAFEITFLLKSSAKIFPASVRLFGLLSNVISDIDFTNSSCLVRIADFSSSTNE